VIRRVECVLVTAVLIVACGKKGPPLAPLHLVPNAVSDAAARRTGGTVHVRFTLPTANLNGPGPVQLDRIEIYAMTLAPGAGPANRVLMSDAYRVATLPVKPAPVEGEPQPADAAADTRLAPGDVATFDETLTPGTLIPVPLPAPATPQPAAAAPTAATPALPTYNTRIYIVRGVTRSGRPGQPSPRLPVPLVDPPAPPSGLAATFTESATTLAWTALPVTTGTATVAFNVYKADIAAALNATPLTTPAFEHPGAEFGVEQCFTVRTVATVEGVSIESESSSPVCVTPKDVFPPAAPQRLQAVPTPGVINLSWQANNEPDVAGYVVLRGEAPGDTLQALTPEPIAVARFEDRTAMPGVRYVYAVVAVDRATPPNTSAQSNRLEETAR
jgi:hypothetical protein